jgi:hypothetical protein
MPPRNATPQQMARKQWLLAAWYESKGALKRATEVRNEALGEGNSNLAFAKADDIRYTRPAEFNAKLAQVNTNLDKTLGAKKDALLATIASRQELAQFGAEARMDIARLAAQSALERTQLQQGGALKREREIQSGANQRNVFDQSHADARALNSQNGADYRAQLGDTTRATIAANAEDMRKAIAIYTQQMTNARKGTAAGSPVNAAGIGFPPIGGAQPGLFAGANVTIGGDGSGASSQGAPTWYSGDNFRSFPPVTDPAPANPNPNPRVTPPPIPNKTLPANGMRGTGTAGAAGALAPPPLVDAKFVTMVQESVRRDKVNPVKARDLLISHFHKTPEEAAAIMRAAFPDPQGGGLPGMPPFSQTP